MSKEVESKYQMLEEREKILIRPARYVGAIEPHTEEQWLLVNDKMERVNTTWNPAFLKLFDEIISNSTDHSKTPEGSHMKTVKVELNDMLGTISVYDDGGIPIVKHKEHDLYIPDMIFGHLHSGSNFDDTVESTGAGQNGEGSTLVNIFSTEFIVESADGKNEFFMTYRNNMSEKSEPTIKKSKKKFTRITWDVDKQYIKTGLGDLQNTEKLIKRVYDAAACNPHLKFYINEKLIEVGSFKDYVKLFIDDLIIHEDEHWKIAFAPSKDGDFEHVSFVNGTASPQGGTHIEYIIDQVVEPIRQHVKRKTKQDIQKGHIRNHLLLFIDATVHNPRYDSQTKERLVTNVSDYGTKTVIPMKVINKIIKSPIMESLMKWVEAKAIQEENKKVAAELKKQGNRDVEKHIEAAGDDSVTKYLHLTEGDSAIGNFVNCRDVESHGGYPLRGKVLNVNGMKASDIIKNTECADMLSIIGLSIGEPVDFSELKYQNIVIMTDADPDGDCICGQLLNFFSMWKELFEQGRVLRLRTPLWIIHNKKGEDLWFYNNEDLKAYTDKHGKPNPKDLEHIKGLGELNEDDYEKCLQQPVYQQFKLSDLSSLELAFGSDAAPRKEWLKG